MDMLCLYIYIYILGYTRVELKAVDAKVTSPKKKSTIEMQFFLDIVDRGFRPKKYVPEVRRYLSAQALKQNEDAIINSYMIH